MIEFLLYSIKKEDETTIGKTLRDLRFEFFELEMKIGIADNGKEEGYRLSIRYKNPALPNKNSYTTLDTSKGESLDIAIKKLIAQNEKEITCKHEYVRPSDKNNNPLEDGRGVCKLCGFENPKALPKGEKVVIKNSCNEDICSTMAWDKDTYLQCGERGIVFGKKSAYSTAFVEAFLSIDGISTFVRGEGEDILAAEKTCFDKVKKMKSCEEHKYTRIFSGKERRDGYARCTECELSGNILAPLDKCSVCNKPTNEAINGTFYCSKHLLDVPLEEVIEDAIVAHQSSPFLNHINVDEIRFNTYIERRIKAFWMEKLGQEKFDREWDKLSKTKVYFIQSLLGKHFGKKKLFGAFDYPDIDHPDIEKGLAVYFSSEKRITDFVKGKGKGELKISDLS
jgi:hypothetical protein